MRNYGSLGKPQNFARIWLGCLTAYALAPALRQFDLGCGPRGALELISERIGSTEPWLGSKGIASPLGWQTRLVADHGLANVEVLQGEATATVLPGARFDLVHARLLFVNVPQVEDIVCEMVVWLARPGGVVASHEADYAAQFCDPPSLAWDRLFEVLKRYCCANGIDPFIGRRVHRLFRDAGLINIQVNPVIHVYAHGHSRRAIFWQFLQNVGDGIVDQKHMAESEFRDSSAELKEQLDHPDTPGGITAVLSSLGPKTALSYVEQMPKLKASMTELRPSFQLPWKTRFVLGRGLSIVIR
jgi:hypothetical protein